MFDPFCERESRPARPAGPALSLKNGSDSYFNRRYFFPFNPLWLAGLGGEEKIIHPYLSIHIYPSIIHYPSIFIFLLYYYISLLSLLSLVYYYWYTSSDSVRCRAPNRSVTGPSQLRIGTSLRHGWCASAPNRNPWEWTTRLAIKRPQYTDKTIL